MPSFELETLGGEFKVVIASGPADDYGDGGIRISPPVFMSEDAWEYVNIDAAVTFSTEVVGTTASIVSYAFDHPRRDTEPTFKARIKDLGELLVGLLSGIESKDSFIELNKLGRM